MFLTFDTETTGLPKNFKADVSDSDNWPRLVQLAWQLNDETGKLISNNSLIVKPEGFTIPYNSEKVHGISTEKALKEGEDLEGIIQKFEKDVKNSKYVIGHNINFDLKIIGAEHFRLSFNSNLNDKINLDTGQISKKYCNLKGGFGGGLKMPKLIEMYEILFNEKFSDAHDASHDVNATAKCFFELAKKGEYANEDLSPDNINYEGPQLTKSNFQDEEIKDFKKDEDISSEILTDNQFIHLHNHSQYSVLQATSSIEKIIEKTIESGMNAVAVTDLGNMFGAFKFSKIAKKNNIKKIIGSEFFISEERKKTKFTREKKDIRHNQVLIAKNKNGYNNLLHLSSLAYTEGLYG